MAVKRTLVLGTHNLKKREELVALLAPFLIELKTLADYPNAIEVVEDGATFGDNARKKATVQAQNLGEWVLGEDSGLCVEALNGRPGVYSARYAGFDAGDDDNNRKLVAELGKSGVKAPQAFYVCHAALSNPQGEVLAECEETCRGVIVETARGAGGFGYDPHFEVPEYHKTFGELGGAVKSVLSHRARAMRKMVGDLVGRVK